MGENPTQDRGGEPKSENPPKDKNIPIDVPLSRTDQIVVNKARSAVALSIITAAGCSVLVYPRGAFNLVWGCIAICGGIDWYIFLRWEFTWKGRKIALVCIILDILICIIFAFWIAWVAAQDSKNAKDEADFKKMVKDRFADQDAWNKGVGDELNSIKNPPVIQTSLGTTRQAHFDAAIAKLTKQKCIIIVPKDCLNALHLAFNMSDVMKSHGWIVDVTTSTDTVANFTAMVYVSLDYSPPKIPTEDAAKFVAELQKLRLIDDPYSLPASSDVKGDDIEIKIGTKPFPDLPPMN